MASHVASVDDVSVATVPEVGAGRYLVTSGGCGSIAASLLRKEIAPDKVVDLVGGYSAWTEAS